MRARYFGVAGLVAFVALFAPDHVQAQSLEKARGLYLDADFETALAEFEAVLDRPGLSVDEAVEAHRYLSALRSLLGDKTASEAHARAALALDPSAGPAQGASKQVVKLFAALRKELGGKASTLTISTDGDVVKDQPLTVRATLDPAPEGLAAMLTLRCVQGADESVEQNGAPPTVEVQLPSVLGEVNCRASAMTEARAPLFTARERFAPPGEESVMPMASASRRPAAGRGRRGGSAWPWIIGGGVIAAGAVVAVVLLTSGGGDGVKINTDVEGLGW
jgi:hypothetical protein